MLEVRERSHSKRDLYHEFRRLSQALRFESRDVEELSVKRIYIRGPQGCIVA
jgi:hypothetical protein